MEQVGPAAERIMRRDVVTVRDDCDIRDVLRLFREKRISGAPVVDARGKVVGVVAVGDLTEAPLCIAITGRESHYYQTCPQDGMPPSFHIERYHSIPVGELMAPLVIDAPAHTPACRLAALMVDLGIHRVLITSGGKLLGEVTSHDLLKIIRDRCPDPQACSGETPSFGDLARKPAK